MNLTARLVQSWANRDGCVHSTAELLDWIETRNRDVAVSIKKAPFRSDGFWFYDREEGVLRNRNRSFFSIRGIQVLQKGEVLHEQPIILQQEIGYLGILCKELHGILHFLMQAKIEPGNLNKIQISPTIQATKSNFTQRHGGSKPPYLDYFLETPAAQVVVDQIQSEQSSRFYHKRNRNLVVEVFDEVEVLPSHRWMTLGQIKALMKFDNLVNMDTRTVLSCLPFGEDINDASALAQLQNLIPDQALFRSLFEPDSNELPAVFQYCNNYKMFSEPDVRFCALHELTSWDMGSESITCRKFAPFQVIYCDISMEGREVQHWQQPLFEAVGKAFFGLFVCRDEGVFKFLVSAKPEIGCFDGIELAPSVQLEAGVAPENEVDCLFMERYRTQQGILYNVLLSEEGGRFYHEQNHNVILEIERDELILPPGYFWLTYRTLNRLVQVNNVLNIQLRNLLSLLEVSND